MPVVTDLLDTPVPLAAFRLLEEPVRVHGEVLPCALLHAGFVFDGRRVPLVSQQGIFKPRVLPELPLSIRTSVLGQYDDSLGQGDLPLYAYRGTDPEHHENRGLREAMRRRVPLVYLFGLLEGRYLPVWPVTVVGDDPGVLHFTVAADDSRLARLPQADSFPSGVSYSGEGELGRRYVTREVRQRSTSSSSASGSWRPTAGGARCAGCATRSCSKRRTSSRTPRSAARRRCATGSRCAGCTTPRTTRTCWPSGRTTPSR